MRRWSSSPSSSSSSSSLKFPLRRVGAGARSRNVGGVGIGKEYNGPALSAYFLPQPIVLLRRVAEVGWGAIGLIRASGKVLREEDDNKRRRQGNGSAGEELREAVVVLGPAFLKLAQSASTRPEVVELFGQSIAVELAMLQDTCPPFPDTQAKRIIDEEIGLDNFSSISASPVAAASFGQVYKCVRHSSSSSSEKGEVVAVKVQRPGVRRVLALDLILARLGAAVVRRIFGTRTDLVALIDATGTALFEELDYQREAQAMKAFEARHECLRSIMKVPKVYTELTSNSVLSTEWIDGEKPLEMLQEGEVRQKDLLQLVYWGVECSLTQLLVSRYLHGDPHPGNIMYTGKQLVYLDFGLTTEVEKRHADAMLLAVAHILTQQYEALAQDFVNLDLVYCGTDMKLVATALKEELQPQRETTTGIQFRTLAASIVRVALRFRFTLPPYFVSIFRALGTLEGLALQVLPSFRIVDAAYPQVLKILLTRHRGRMNDDLILEFLFDKDKMLRTEIVVEILKQRRATSGGTVLAFNPFLLVRWLLRCKKPVLVLKNIKALLSLSFAWIKNRVSDKEFRVFSFLRERGKRLFFSVSRN